MAKTVTYKPTVPKDEPIAEPEPTNPQILQEAYLVGEAVQNASMRLRGQYPGWAAFWDHLWYHLNDIFGSE